MQYLEQIHKWAYCQSKVSFWWINQLAGEYNINEFTQMFIAMQVLFDGKLIQGLPVKVEQIVKKA